jgi:hypothetical protein
MNLGGMRFLRTFLRCYLHMSSLVLHIGVTNNWSDGSVQRVCFNWVLEASQRLGGFGVADDLVTSSVAMKFAD